MGNKTMWKDSATDAHQVGEDGRVIGSRVDILKAENVLGHDLATGTVVYRVVKMLFLNEEQARCDTRILGTRRSTTGPVRGTRQNSPRDLGTTIWRTYQFAKVVAQAVPDAMRPRVVSARFRQAEPDLPDSISEAPSGRNSKSEARNTKQIQSTKEGNPKQGSDG